MFYISTYGGSGSVWLARVLSLHPSVVCFHGSTSLPPDVNGWFPPLDPERYAWGLLQCEGACRGSKIFGAIHGFHGTDAKYGFEAMDGVFAGLLRHPIMRINSLWHGHRKTLSEGGHSADLPVESDPSNIVRVDRQTGLAELGEATRLFAELCHGTIGGDTKLIGEVDRDHLFRFEDVTSDRAAFAAMFDRLVAASPRHKDVRIAAAATADYLDAVFTTGADNVRAGVKTDPAAIYDAWPDILKLIFSSTIQTFGGSDVIAAYRKMEYELPDSISSLIQTAPKKPVQLAPAPTDPFRLDYTASAPVNAILDPSNISDPSRGGVSLLGGSFVPTRQHVAVRLEVSVTAYSETDNEIVIAVLDAAGRMLYVDVKAVEAGNWVHFAHIQAVHKDPQRTDIAIDVRVGISRVGGIFINGPTGELPDDAHGTFLSISNMEESILAGAPGDLLLPGD